MSVPLLATKLYAPPPPARAVRRARLIDRLNEGLSAGHKLTLLAAPAGFGKTSLAGEWAAGCGRPAAWLSLDEGDGDPARFLAYLVAGLQTVMPAVGEGMLSVLQAPQPPPIQVMLTALLNEITSIPGDILLVLDDYHLIDAGPVDAALTFLLEHLPPRLHLVIATREDPRLPLARLRARNQLTELRAADLRFTPSEVSGFLQAMGLDLGPDDVTALEDRTEGWIVGLQLAALSMQGRQDIPGFIRAFAGDHRYIVDYLVQEVLLRQPEPVRSFLLQTAILERLNGPLCDAVTGNRTDGSGLPGSAQLEALERGNFFVVPLDDKRHWYRYHHLFADVLCARLTAERPDLIPVLHRRASEWYEQNGMRPDAIRHALAAGDFERAADLIEAAVPALRQSRREATILGWLRALPGEVVRRRPVLGVHYAGALLVSGELDGVEERLQDAERWLDSAPDTDDRPARAAETSVAETLGVEAIVVDAEEFRRLPGTIAVYRAAIAQARGDAANAMKYARRVLDLAPEDDHLRRGSAAGFLALAYWTRGELETAHGYYADCMASVLKVGHVSDAIGCAIALADIRTAQGRLREAMSTFERGLSLATAVATEGNGPPLRGAADMYVGMSRLLYERNDLGAAMQCLQKSRELGEDAGLPQNPYRWRVAMARIRQAQGDLDGALDLIEEAERLYAGDFFPNVHPPAAWKARIWLAQGRLSQALDWAHERGLSADDDLSYLHEFEYMTLARALLAQYQTGQAGRSLRVAMDLLDRLLKAAEEGGRTRSVIEILALQAVAHQSQGDLTAALGSLRRALAPAQPEGYMRTFLDEGPPMQALLREAMQRAIAPDYVRQLLRAFGAIADKVSADQSLVEPAALIEPLSERELEVLRLFGTDLDGPEMARELTISLNTLRTHTKNIYGKLGANNRRAAVRRAEELDLL